MLLLHGNSLLVRNHTPRHCWLAPKPEEGTDESATVEVTPPQQPTATECVWDCRRKGGRGGPPDSQETAAVPVRLHIV